MESNTIPPVSGRSPCEKLFQWGRELLLSGLFESLPIVSHGLRKFEELGSKILGARNLIRRSPGFSSIVSGRPSSRRLWAFPAPGSKTRREERCFRTLSSSSATRCLRSRSRILIRDGEPLTFRDYGVSNAITREAGHQLTGAAFSHSKEVFHGLSIKEPSL